MCISVYVPGVLQVLITDQWEKYLGLKRQGKHPVSHFGLRASMYAKVWLCYD